jgi:hypothetical protein
MICQPSVSICLVKMRLTFAWKLTTWHLDAAGEPVGPQAGARRHRYAALPVHP